MFSLELNGFWKLRHEHLSVSGETGLKATLLHQTDWLQATVPGEVHLDLIAAGLMEEPLFSTNAPACRWPEDRSWWYVTELEMAEEQLQEHILELVFDGLDFYAQVFVNGTLLAECENAFVPATVNVRHALRLGMNQLAVRLTAGTERATNPTTGESTAANIYGNRQAFKGVSELRKPQFSYGWDWVDALPNIGIWRGVRLVGYSHQRIRDVRTETVLRDGACLLHVDVDVANLHPWAEQTGRLTVSLTAPTGQLVQAVDDLSVPVGITRKHVSFAVDDPHLWWPNGMGEQPLYDLNIQVENATGHLDTWQRQIGLRTVGIDRSPLPEGRRFVIQVNGEDVFCRGGNWIPADAIIARVDAAKIEALIENAREANLTMLRIWGGGVYEADAFYEACDRKGILVWQDFMFACHTYPDDRDDFCHNVRLEAEMAIRRLRHHACIALWCGNNENLQGFASWWNKGRSFPAPDMQLGGHRVYSEILPEACLALDPSRPYWPGSPAGGDDPLSEIDGDCHWWGPGTMNADISRRYRDEVYDECRSRFVSEYGVVGPCHIESVREFLRPEEMDLNGRAWRIHTNSFEKETTPAAIAYHYAAPEGLAVADFIRYGQMFQATMYGRTIESMRFRKGDPEDDCSGALIWMYNDCWGESGWTPVDYYLRRKASYYWIKNVCTPVRAIVRRRDDELVTRVVNDSLGPVSCTVACGWYRVDGSDTDVTLHDVVLPANSMVEIARVPIPGNSARPHSSWVYAAHCEGHAPSVLSLLPFRQLDRVSHRIQIERAGLAVTLISQTYCHGVRHHDAGQPLLSDNYFDLLPGVPRTIHCNEAVPDLAFEALP